MWEIKGKIGRCLPGPAVWAARPHLIYHAAYRGGRVTPMTGDVTYHEGGDMSRVGESRPSSVFVNTRSDRVKYLAVAIPTNHVLFPQSYTERSCVL